MFEELLSTDPDCRCEATFEGDRLLLDGSACSGDGRLATVSACRATAIEALRDRDAESVRTWSAGFERTYEGRAAGLLVAAGRFSDAAAFHDDTLAERARSDPLGAARVATGRGDPLARLAAETGLEAFVGCDYETALRPHVGPALARSRIATRPPAEATLKDRHELDSGAVVRRYENEGLATYHLIPVEHRLDAAATATLAKAHERLASGAVSGGERAASRAVRSVAEDGQLVGTLASVLEKHTRGLGILEDCFADASVTDVFATAPVADNPLRLRRDGETLRTNVRLT
ncbi:MAG: type II secretion protein, partial [Natronomonas sp.]